MKSTKAILLLVAAFSALWVLTACSVQPQAGDAAEETAIKIALAAPDGAEGDHLQVTLIDEEGAPVTDATVSLEGNMNHAGMVPVFAEGVRDDADGTADGVYRVPFEFTMMGDWIISVVVEMADGSTIQRDIDAVVTADAVEME